VSKLKDQLKIPGGFDWASLGVEAGVCFNAIPSGVCFLNGPLSDGQPVRVRQRTQRKPLEVEEGEAKEERPEDVQGHTARSGDGLAAGEANMKVLERILHEKVADQYKTYKRHFSEVFNGDIPKPVIKKLKKSGVEICGAKYLINPDSFTQTVENIFNFSFMIKKGEAAIAVREDGYYAEEGLKNRGGLRVKYTSQENIDTKPKQAIVSLSMQDFRRLKEAYGVTEGDLPHRTGSKHSKRPASSQKLTQDSSA
jgi:hypothetical protein